MIPDCGPRLLNKTVDMNGDWDHVPCSTLVWEMFQRRSKIICYCLSSDCSDVGQSVMETMYNRCEIFTLIWSTEGQICFCWFVI